MSVNALAYSLAYRDPTRKNKVQKKTQFATKQWNRPSTLASIGPMDIGEFAEWKPGDTGRVSVTVNRHWATTWRHFERLSDVLVQLKVRYTAPVLRC